jgi:NADH:ubiquinone oxidoreductase subunit 2 (subunit N)
VVVALEQREQEGVLLDDYRGLGKRYPWIAICMAFFMLSLTGIPPTGGFAAKFFVFRTAIEANLVWLTLIGVLTSVISGYYYLRVVFLMYMYDGERELIAAAGAAWLGRGRRRRGHAAAGPAARRVVRPGATGRSSSQRKPSPADNYRIRN